MSKRIILSLLSAAAMSIGGWFVSCGSNDAAESHMVMVQLPEGCILLSPKSPLGALDSMGTVANVKPGMNNFVVDVDGREIEVRKKIAGDQQIVTISRDELR